MLRTAGEVVGLTFTELELKSMLQGLNANVSRYQELRRIPIDNSVAPALYFNPLLPGMKIDRSVKPFRANRPPRVKRPQNPEELAFLAVTQLAELIRTKQVTSVQLSGNLSGPAEAVRAHLELRRHLNRGTCLAASA